MLAASLLVAALTGCANFEAAKEFAKQGNDITTAVNAEIAFVAKGCADSVGMYRALQADPTVTGPLDKACEAQDKALGELAASTLDLFGKYNKALAAVAEDKNYDLSASFKSTADRLKALKEKSGPIIKGEDVDVALKAANLLSDLTLRVVRARELKQLVAAGDTNWAAVMSPLKTYFGPHAGNRQVVPSPYEISIRANESPLEAAVAMARSVSGPKLSGDGPGCVVPSNRTEAFEIRCETMWARQLNYQVTQKRKAFQDRLPNPSKPDEPAPTAKKIHEAIDAWLAAHAVLREEISNPSATQVWAALQQLKGRVDELDEALKARQ
jgi:hypothetical protein